MVLWPTSSLGQRSFFGRDAHPCGKILIQTEAILPNSLSNGGTRCASSSTASVSAPSKPGMIRPHLRRNAIAGEQEARADHVDRANDDRRHGGVGEPFTVVDVLAAQRRDRQRTSGRDQASLYRLALVVAIEPGAELFRLGRRLIDDSTPIDNVHEPPWNAVLVWLLRKRSRQQPDSHHRRLAEPRRQIKR